MSARGPATRVAGWLTAVLGLSAALMGVWCGAALAHAQLLGTEPAAGAELAESPDQVRLRFSEPVEAEFSPLEVYDSGGDRVDEDDARVDPDDAKVVLVGLGEELPEGSYTVDWRVTSIDGHVVEGTYEFAVVGDRGTGESSDTPRTAAEGTAEGPAARSGPDGGQDAGAGGPHGWHFAALGLVVLVALLAVVLRRR